MKRIIFVLLLVAAVAQPAMAGTITTLSTMGTYAAGSGGEFTLLASGFGLNGYVDDPYTKNLLQQGTFQSFCLEVHEYISTNAVYNALKNTNAVKGGVGGPGDPLSQGTGWLYSQFAAGTLPGYNFLGTIAERKASARALQNTIWWLEDEGADPGNAFSILVAGQFADPKAGSASTYGVYALNLTQGQARPLDRQDVLYYDPQTVPDGGTTLMLLGGALMGLGALSRKFRR